MRIFIMIEILGFVTKKDSLKWISGTPYLPWFSFHEIHESGTIVAKPEKIIAAVSALDMRSDWAANILLSVRELPSKISKLFCNPPHNKKTLPFGFDTFTLLQRNSHELSMGLIGRFWRPDLGIIEISNAQEFRLFDNTNVAKLVLRFQVIEYPKDICTLRTETFIYCPNLRVKMFFTPYWLLIRIASGWIRRRTLISIQKALLV
jgi:hypothetical protein